MDPLTIVNAAGAALSTAKTAWEVGTSLYIFFEQAKKVDQQLQAFSEEVKSLGAACEVIGTRLEDIYHSSKDLGVKSPFGRADKLWSCLQDQLSACQKTAIALQDAVQMPERVQNIKTFDKIFKQIVLVLKANDIAEVRNRIRSHTASLQILLQGMTIELTYLGPHRADQELHNKLSELAKKNDELTALLKERHSSNANDGKEENQLLQASSQIISSGETLYAASVAGGSVLGDTDPSSAGRVSNWIEHTNALESINSGPSTPTETDTASLWTDRVAATEETLSVYSPPTTQTLDPLPGEMPPVETDELDSDDEFGFEAATHAIEAGRVAFKAGDYDETNRMLQEALVMIRELPVSKQKGYDASDLRYMLSVCSFHLQDATTAKVTLLHFIEHTSSAKIQDDKRRLRICDAGHLLAQACMKLGEYEQARTYCESAMQGRRRLLGKQNEATFESLALMVRILELQGMVERAVIISKMIPDAQKDAIVRYRALPTPRPGTESEASGSSLRLRSTQSIPRIAVSAHDQPTSSSAAAGPSNALVQSTGQLSLSTSQSPTIPRQPVGYQDPYIKEWVRIHSYQRPSPMARDKDTRKMWVKKFHIAIKTKLLKALAESRDEDALVLAQGGRGGFWDRHYSAGGPPELHVAALYGQVETVEQLLAVGADVHYKSRWGLQPLHCAAATGYVKIAQMLIAAGAPIDDPSDVVGTPLCLAVLRKRMDVVDLLLRHGANPLAPGGKLGSPLHAACATNNVALVRALSTDNRGLSEVREIEADMFWNVIKDDMPERDYSKHADRDYELPIVDCKMGFRRLRSVKVKPLEFAALRGANAVVTHLLAREVYIHGQCSIVKDDHHIIDNHTALSLAAMTGSLPVCRSLLRYVPVTAFPGEKNPNIDPLHLAATNRHEAVANMFLDAGAQSTHETVTWSMLTWSQSHKGQQMPELVERLGKSITAPVNTAVPEDVAQDALDRPQDQNDYPGPVERVNSDPPPLYEEVDYRR